VLAEHRHEVLARSVLEVEHPGPESGGAGGTGGLDHRLEAVRTVGEAGEDRGQSSSSTVGILKVI
jgi:hypothetical protein